MNRPNWFIIALSLALAVIVLFSLVTPAQDKYKSGDAPAYHNAKLKTDLEFAQFLRHDWMKTEMLPGLKRDETPKPEVQPIAEVTPEAEEELESSFEESRTVERVTYLPPPPPPSQPNPWQDVAPPPTTDYTQIEVNFFGSPADIKCDPDLKVYLGNTISAQAIAEFWENTARADYTGFLAEAMHYRIRLGLNDWAYAMFLYRFGEQLYSDVNAARLFTWFMLVQAGFDARVGYGENHVYLLLPSQSFLYGISYFTLGGGSYYVAPFGGEDEIGTLYIYQETYPGAERFLNVQVRRPPDVQKVAMNRSLTFEDRGQSYTVSIEYNKSVIDFFNEYPQTDLDIYFKSSVSKDVAESLVNSLKPYIQGKTEAEAVNFLLHFVQIGFQYKTDGDQFGREKYFFAEETFYYAFCDCEDRSILFSYLVRSLLGLPVIGLDYPGHVAAAVKFSDPVPGDYVYHDGQKYLICDPTYIYANIGMCMPSFKQTQPTVIEISS